MDSKYGKMLQSAKPSTRNAMGSLTSCSVLRMYHASTAPQTRPCLGRGKAIITTTPAIHCGVDVACHSAYASEGLGASTSWSCVPINSMRTLSASVFLIPHGTSLLSGAKTFPQVDTARPYLHVMATRLRLSVQLEFIHSLTITMNCISLSYSVLGSKSAGFGSCSLLRSCSALYMFQ